MNIPTRYHRHTLRCCIYAVRPKTRSQYRRALKGYGRVPSRSSTTLRSSHLAHLYRIRTICRGRAAFPSRGSMLRTCQERPSRQLPSGTIWHRCTLPRAVTRHPNLSKKRRCRLELKLVRPPNTIAGIATGKAYFAESDWGRRHTFWQRSPTSSQAHVAEAPGWRMTGTPKRRGAMTSDSQGCEGDLPPCTGSWYRCRRSNPDRAWALILGWPNPFCNGGAGARQSQARHSGPRTSGSDSGNGRPGLRGAIRRSAKTSIREAAIEADHAGSPQSTSALL